ncbi:MAG: hypothetical protein ACLP1X_05150, partial [Polyangiaceae bacterium]
ALSSCPAGEGHTWGKVSAESVATGSVYVHADVTAVFPWLTYALLADPKMKRKPPRLFDARAIAVTNLKRAVGRRRSKLLSTVAYPMVREPATRAGKGAASRGLLRGKQATMPRLDRRRRRKR